MPLPLASLTPLTPLTPLAPWYKEGLRFKCTGCGRCCTGKAGYVWVSVEEMQSMANVLNISLDLFKRKYTRIREQKYALVEKITLNKEYACVFLQDNKCLVYQARPLQCRTFPWWPENLNNPESWALAAQECEGITDQAPIVPYSEIEANL